MKTTAGIPSFLLIKGKNVTPTQIVESNIPFVEIDGNTDEAIMKDFYQSKVICQDGNYLIKRRVFLSPLYYTESAKNEGFERLYIGQELLKHFNN